MTNVKTDRIVGTTLIALGVIVSSLITLVLVVITFMGWAVTGATHMVPVVPCYIAYAWLFNVLIWAGLIAHIRADRAEDKEAQSTASRIAKPYAAAAAAMFAVGIIVPSMHNWSARTPLVIDLDTCTASGNLSLLPRAVGRSHSPQLPVDDYNVCTLVIGGWSCNLPKTLGQVTIKAKPVMLFDLAPSDELEYSFDVSSYCQKR